MNVYYYCGPQFQRGCEQHCDIGNPKPQTTLNVGEGKIINLYST